MNQERLLKVILAPHVSEKSTVSAEMSNTLVFKVATDALKNLKSIHEKHFNRLTGDGLTYSKR